MAKEKTIKVYEVLHDGAPGGPAGKPATVQTTDAPMRLARRWGVA